MNSPQRRREQTVKQAIANERLEGLEVSLRVRKIADSYVVGKVSAREVAAKIRARYGSI
jgi:hypothetical protein